MKTYTVMKNGEELETVKTLSAAKKLADEKDAEVFVDGERVYEPESPAAEEKTLPEKYKLTALMNVRKEPALDAEILSTKRAGTEVTVLEIVDDWLHLDDGSYILFGEGRYAEKVE